MSEAPGGGHAAAADGNSSMRFTTIPLNKHNYQTWSRAIIKSLKGRGKIGYITGIKKKPENAEKEKEKTEEWEIEDNQISTWILNSMEPRYCEQFIFTNTAFELWQEILQNSATKIILPAYMN
jgi:gag-polypeptide of LTR copia-type